jgi:NAD(P)H-dependent flavin oxidoreductase YrpB (nitropropane dioxygenase family)
LRLYIIFIYKASKYMLRTGLCDLLGIEYPIFAAPMGFVTGPELAAAVSNAGGFGILSFSGNPPGVLRFMGFPPSIDANGDIESMNLLAGQSAGLVNEIKPAAAIVQELVEGAEKIMKDMRRFLTDMQSYTY